MVNERWVGCSPPIVDHLDGLAYGMAHSRFVLATRRLLLVSATSPMAYFARPWVSWSTRTPTRMVHHGLVDHWVGVGVTMGVSVAARLSRLVMWVFFLGYGRWHLPPGEGESCGMGKG